MVHIWRAALLVAVAALTLSTSSHGMLYGIHYYFKGGLDGLNRRMWALALCRLRADPEPWPALKYTRSPPQLRSGLKKSL